MAKKQGGIMGMLKAYKFWLIVAAVGLASLGLALGLGIQFGIYKLSASEVPTQYEPISSLGNFNSRFERPRPPVDSGLIHNDLFLTGSVALVIGVGIASLTLAIRSGRHPEAVAADSASASESTMKAGAAAIDVSFWGGASISGSNENVTEIGEKAPWLYDPAFRTVCLVVASTASCLALTFALFGQGWDTGHVHTRVPYIAFEKQVVAADLDFGMGIYGYNITMACPDCFEPVPSAEVGECGVDFKTGLYDSCGFFYTYHFSFEAYFQARSGFGKFSNGLNLQWQDAIADGMPLPILEIQSAFIIDGEKIRWQRRYIKAAYGTFVCQWWAATMWILANITGIMWLTSTLAAEKVGVSAQLDDIVYKRSESIWSAFCWSIIGISSGFLLACLTWESVRPGNFVCIAFEDGCMDINRGWTWDLSMGVGIIHLVVGVTLLQYTNIKGMVDRFSADDDAEIAEYVLSSLDLSEAEMTATRSL
jgi:hypothetical protein